ncbi:MAG: hypothetical protein GY770_25155 [Aestuariibacter sp.]|nr:hypothetical protein [Aestuariibacter sp.]MCP4236827.1 hypothetical protein [Aestuariibacter sp.]MCP4595049.1 hypothetical protein [Neptuniibacter sp.]
MNVLLDSVKNGLVKLRDELSEKISKWFPALSYLPRDNELVKIHGVFRSKNLLKNKDIFVAVEWKDGITSSLPIEMASFLAPGSTFQDKKIVSQTKHERQNVHIISLERVDKASGHYQYLYKTDHGLMKFSGFELARTLLFHNPHLVRAAYTANGVGGLTLVHHDQSPIEISFPESTLYPLRFIKSKSTRTHLAWLVLDVEAKKSAHSVFESFNKGQGELGFKFVPPNLEGWLLEVSVRADSEDIAEVVRVENILEAVFNEGAADVLVSHPKDKDQSSKDKIDAAKKGQTPADDTDPELELGEIPRLGKRLHIERSKGFSFGCSAIRSVKSSKGKKASGSKHSPPAEAPDIEKEKAGVGLIEKDGNAQEFSPTINQDEEITDTVYLPQKFRLFGEVIEEVGKSDGIKLFQKAKCYRFPAPANQSKVVYKTQYEGRLKYFVAILELTGSQLVLVEADTSNLRTPKGASTLILGLKEDAKANFEEILQSFSDKGAQWSHDFINERCYFFNPCRHPPLKEKGKIRTDQEYKEKWVSDLREKLRLFRKPS